MDWILKYFSIPSLIFLGIALIIIAFLSYLIWWEYWGQFMFNRIIIKNEKHKYIK